METREFAHHVIVLIHNGMYLLLDNYLDAHGWIHAVTTCPQSLLHYKVFIPQVVAPFL